MDSLYQIVLWVMSLFTPREAWDFLIGSSIAASSYIATWYQKGRFEGEIFLPGMLASKWAIGGFAAFLAGHSDTVNQLSERDLVIALIGFSSFGLLSFSEKQIATAILKRFLGDIKFDEKGK